MEHTFHHVLQAAGGAISQLPATPSSSLAESAAIPATPSDASTLTAAPAVEPQSNNESSDGPTDPAAMQAEGAGSSDSNVTVSANEDALAMPLQSIPADPASTTAKPDAPAVKPGEPKRKRTEDANAPLVQTPSAATVVNTPVPFQLPHAVVATAASQKPEADDAAIALRPKSMSSGEAPIAQAPVNADSEGNKDSAAMTLLNGAANTAAIEGAPKDSRRESGSSVGGSVDRPSMSKDGTRDPSMAWQTMPSAEQGATFRSSFLHEAGPSRDFTGQMKDAMESAAEPVLSTVNEGPVKHLEVSLKDAGLGDISVRAEMKDGMLHASVLGGHADSFLTASALHGFLERNQVAIHTVHVESSGMNGIQKTMSTASFASGSSGGKHSGEDQQGRARSMWSGAAMNFNSGERNHWSRMPSMAAQILPQVQYGDGRSLSIHI